MLTCRPTSRDVEELKCAQSDKDEETTGTGGVVKGWEQGFPLLKVGETAKLICPPKLAYGKKGMGDKVPPDSTLEFEVEVNPTSARALPQSRQYAIQQEKLH